MNLYILVEGEATEMQLYPKWLSWLLPELQRVPTYKSVIQNNYYLFCGQGIPHTYKHAANAMHDINRFGNYDYLIVCLDCDELSPQARRQKLLDYLAIEKVELNNLCKLRIVTQNACVESWFLGNRKAFKKNPENEILKNYIKFYNVFENDPEKMGKYGDFTQKAQFHEAYLREMLKEHGQFYRKSNPKVILNEPYLNELQKRVVNEVTHLRSLNHFFHICNEIKNIIHTAT
ncbi:MAG: hypothetical protein RLZZ628_1301 [Bacteroidota bacterium]|jgi:hypothetical protein